MEHEFYSPTYDFVFKKIFQHTAILKHFLETVLNTTFPSIEIISSTQISLAHTRNVNKMVISDVSCKDNQANQYEVQMQRVNEGDVVEKTTYYGERLYNSQLSAGDSYNVLKKTVVIVILNFQYFKTDDDAIRKYCMTDVERKHKIDTIEWHFIELPKVQHITNFAALPTRQCNLFLWLDFLKNAESKINPPRLIPEEIRQAYAMSARSSFSGGEQLKIKERLGILDPYEKSRKENEEMKKALEEEKKKQKIVEEQRKNAEEKMKSAEEKMKIEEEKVNNLQKLLASVLEKRSTEELGLNDDQLELVKKLKKNP